MTDRMIVDGLIARDSVVTRRFFYVSCRPLLTAVMRHVFSYPVDYDELVSELYIHLMENNASRLRLFQFRSSLYQWIKVVATRFFIRKRSEVIDNKSQMPLYYSGEECCYDSSVCAVPEPAYESAAGILRSIDVAAMLDMMSNRRYADTLRALMIDDVAPETYAKSQGITVDNLYNIKRRAMAALSRIALKYYKYE